MRHEKKESRGRPSEKPAEMPRQFTRTYYEFSSKPELGGKEIWHYDLDKTDKGPYLVEFFDPKYDKAEANAYNLRNEVKVAAEKIYGEKNTQFHVFSRIDAYVRAYHEIIDDYE